MTDTAAHAAAAEKERRRPDRIHTIAHPGDITSELRLFDPELTGTARPRAAVLVLPGIAVGARYYDVLARHLADRGFVAAIMELPGQGTHSNTPGRGSRPSGYHDAAYEDIPLALATFHADMRAADHHRPDGTDLPVFLLGHSQGGQLAAYYAGRTTEYLVPHPPVAGIIGVATQSPYFRGYAGSMGRKLFLGSRVLPVIGAVRGAVPETFFGGSGAQPARRLRDWAALARHGKMNPVGADIDYPAGMAASSKPVLAITIEGDQEAPVTAARNWLDFFPAAPRTMRHIAEPIGHNRWARTPDLAVDLVAEWIDGQLGG